jgi:hypothetical protein
LFFFFGGWHLVQALPTPPPAWEVHTASLYSYEALVLITITESASMLLAWMVRQQSPAAVVLLVSRIFLIARAGTSITQGLFLGNSRQKRIEAEDEPKMRVEGEQNTEPEDEQEIKEEDEPNIEGEDEQKAEPEDEQKAEPEDQPKTEVEGEQKMEVKSKKRIEADDEHEATAKPKLKPKTKLKPKLKIKDQQIDAKSEHKIEADDEHKATAKPKPKIKDQQIEDEGKQIESVRVKKRGGGRRERNRAT